MSDYYTDSSVLIKRHLHEIGTPWVRTVTDSSHGHIIVTSHLTVVEVFSAFNRRVREAHIRSADYDLIAGDFLDACANEYEFIQLTPAVIAQARTLLERYPLRAGDAVQLASALLTHTALRSEGFPGLIFLAADDRLLNAAQGEGLSVDNPYLHP